MITITFQKIAMALTTVLLTTTLVVGCGGSGDSASPEEPADPTDTGNGGNGGNGGGNGGNGGGGNGGGEGAGACRFECTLLEELTDPSVPAHEKQLRISTPCISGDGFIEFVTNDGIDEGDGECYIDEFIDQYESDFGVLNTDCSRQQQLF